MYPLNGQQYEVDPDLRVILETKICNAAVT